MNFEHQSETNISKAKLKNYGSFSSSSKEFIKSLLFQKKSSGGLRHLDSNDSDYSMHYD